MWDYTIEKLDDRTHRIIPQMDGRSLAFAQILKLWQHDAAFVEYFTSLLCAAPYKSYRWEAPPISRANVGREFEFVLLDEPGLSGQPADSGAFAQHLGKRKEGGSVSFANLANDALLVVPRPIEAATDYAHLAAFMRSGTRAQISDLWQTVGAQVEARLGATPRWLSTAGMGVPWLHVRIDSRPKYYGHAPYRRWRE